MIKYHVINKTNHSLQLNIKTIDGTKTLTVCIHKKSFLPIFNTQITGDVVIKERKKLISLEPVEMSSVELNAPEVDKTVELDTQKNKFKKNKREN